MLQKGHFYIRRFYNKNYLVQNYLGKRFTYSPLFLKSNTHLIFKIISSKMHSLPCSSVLSETPLETGHPKRNRLPFEVKQIPLLDVPSSESVKIEFINGLSFNHECVYILIPSVATSCMDTLHKHFKDFLTSLGFSESVTTELLNSIKKNSFTGDEQEILTYRMDLSGNNSKLHNIHLVGIGSGNQVQYNTEDIGSIEKDKNNIIKPISSPTSVLCGKMIGNHARKYNNEKMSIVVDCRSFNPNYMTLLLQYLHLSFVKDYRYKTPSPSVLNQCNNNLANFISGIDFHIMNGDNSLYKNNIQKWDVFAKGIQLSRDVAISPPNYCTTESFANVCKMVASKYNLKINILNEKDCVARKMGAYLSVAQGSLYECQFVHMVYTPSTEIRKKIVLIGKTICMDTGGYNLKVKAHIETMKYDMAGGASVLGAARIIGELKPDFCEVHFIFPAAENMVSSRATRPGDIVVASDGTTVEIINTDAEGRLTLADALVYANKEIKPDYMIDCATLTGAVMVGLGEDVAGFYCNDSKFKNIINQVSSETGTPLWFLPLYLPYRTHNKTPTADIRNCSDISYGGSITAALFLNHFVKDTVWCHIDLAGPTVDKTNNKAEGFGVDFLANLVFKISKDHC